MRLKGKCLACGKKIEYHPSCTKGKYCNNKCQGQHRTIKANEERITLLKQGKLIHRNRIKKALIALGMKHECSICGISQWRGQSLSLVLDHIDGKANNNLLDNFRLLCHNCDSQTEHYKGRNKGNGRKSLGLL
jgi:hypothetical protein